MLFGNVWLVILRQNVLFCLLVYEGQKFRDFDFTEAAACLGKNLLDFHFQRGTACLGKSLLDFVCSCLSF